MQRPAIKLARNVEKHDHLLSRKIDQSWRLIISNLFESFTTPDRTD